MWLVLALLLWSDGKTPAAVLCVAAAFWIVSLYTGSKNLA